MDYIHRRLRFKNCFSVPSISHSGGLVLFWSDDVLLNVMSSSAHHIDAGIEVFGDFPPSISLAFMDMLPLLSG